MEIRRIESAERLSDAFAVRRAVFVEEQGVPEAREMDGNDSEAIHFVVYDDEEPIGAARLRQDDDGAERTAKVNWPRGQAVGLPASTTCFAST